MQIYNRQELANSWWTARTRKADADGYYTKSMNTTDKATAEVKAVVWYNNLQVKIDQGNVPVSKSVNQICDLYLKQLKSEVNRGDRSQRNYDDYKTVVDKFIREYFGKKQIDRIRTKDVENFIIWRQDYYLTGKGSKQKTVTYLRKGKPITRPAQKPKGTTVSALATLKTALNGAFTTAVRADFMAEQNVPRIEISTRRTKAKSTQKRPAFSKIDYDTIVRKSTPWAKKGATKALNDRRLLLREYFLILVNSGLRPGSETDGLLWKHVTFPKNKSGAKYPLLQVTGKTGSRDVAAMPRSVAYFGRLKKYQQVRTGSNPTPNQHVFSTPDGMHVKHSSLRQVFEIMIKAIGVTQDARGGKYTLYSCRHTYATFRLTNAEIPITLLAKNMGTSIEMIERHYGHLDVRNMADVLGSHK